MAYKSEFSLGNGRMKEVAGLQYDDTTGGSEFLSASVLLKMGAGFQLDGATLTDVALGGAGYLSNTIIPTKGYVDEAIAGVTPGIPGDATFKDFSVAETSSFAVGSVVALDTAGLVLADADSEVASNAIGVVLSRSAPSGAGTVRVQLDGEVAVSTSLNTFTKGALVWVSPVAGALVAYTGLSTGDYAVQVGIVSDNAASPDGKIVLQPRIFGLVG
jgi:hypothetical protein